MSYSHHGFDPADVDRLIRNRPTHSCVTSALVEAGITVRALLAENADCDENEESLLDLLLKSWSFKDEVELDRLMGRVLNCDDDLVESIMLHRFEEQLETFSGFEL